MSSSIIMKSEDEICRLAHDEDCCLDCSQKSPYFDSSLITKHRRYRRRKNLIIKEAHNILARQEEVYNDLWGSSEGDNETSSCFSDSSDSAENSAKHHTYSSSQSSRTQHRSKGKTANGKYSKTSPEDSSTTMDSNDSSESL